jgi:hypothetical protein
MRHTISTLAIAAVTFAATFAFAPAIANVMHHFAQDQSRTAAVSSPAKQNGECRSPIAQIVAALGQKDCK